MTHEEFCHRFPEFRKYPKHIIGASGKPILLMDAKLADLRAYQDFLEKRIARVEVEELERISRL